MTVEGGAALSSTNPDERSVVLLLVDRTANRRQLVEWLEGRYQVVTTADQSPAEALDRCDLCLVDERSFGRHREAIAAARSDAEPLFLPVLLVLTRSGVDRLTDEWALVDDVVETPVRQTELRARLGVLLRARRYSRALERRNERLERFAGTVSHDLRNPLTIARGFLESAMEQGDTAGLDSVDHALDRMEAIINDLLSMARSDSPLNEREPVHLGVVAMEAWNGIDHASANLLNEFGETSVEGDESRVIELFENLFRNAVEHGDPGVTVTVGPTDDGFYIEDDGPGIPAEDQDTVFDYGYSSAPGGTGFGLAIVEGIAEAHGWSVRATEGSDGGARFEFTDVVGDVDSAATEPSAET